MARRSSAFVEGAQREYKITVILPVYSPGRYLIPDLAAWDYRVTIRSFGYRADPRDADLTADHYASFVSRCRGFVHWNEISQSSGQTTLPSGKREGFYFL